MTDAAAEIIRCQQVLQYSYAYGYFLKDDTPHKTLFETQQGRLEAFTDELHDKTEKRVDDPERQHEVLLGVTFCVFLCFFLFLHKNRHRKYVTQ